MSLKLIALANSYITAKISADDFENQFLSLWRAEANSGELANDEHNLGLCASEIFSLVDCYTPYTIERESELDAPGLAREVKATLEKYGFI